MAEFDVHGFENLLTELDRIGRTDEVAPKMMNAGMEVLQEHIIAEASKHEDTGEMVASIKPTGITVSANGSYYMCTRPTGYDSRKRQRIRNMEKLVYLEYGVKGRPATPVIKTAVIRAEQGVIQAMRKVFENEVGGR